MSRVWNGHLSGRKAHSILLMGVYSSCAVIGGTTYSILAFGTGWRGIQAMGLPIIGLAAIAAGKASVDVMAVLPKRKKQRACFMLISLSLLIAAVGVALAKQQLDSVAAEDSGVLQRISALRASEQWRDLTLLETSPEVRKHADGLLDIAYAWRQLGDLDKARSVYERSIALSPQNCRGRYELGRLYEGLGEARLAEAQYVQILRLDDSLPDVHLAYGILKTRQGELLRAIDHLSRAKELYSADHLAQRQIPALLEAIRTKVSAQNAASGQTGAP